MQNMTLVLSGALKKLTLNLDTLASPFSQKTERKNLMAYEVILLLDQASIIHILQSLEEE